MRRVIRWVGIVLGSLVGLVLVAYAAFYILSERVMRRTYEIPAITLSLPTDPTSITEGRRLATIRGCFGGCHGKAAEGEVMIDEPMLARLVAPNLTAAVRKYSDAELAVSIRNGVRPGGRSLLVMPSEAFVVLNDEDLGRIIAFLKTAAQLIAETIPPPEAIRTLPRAHHLRPPVTAQIWAAIPIPISPARICVLWRPIPRKHLRSSCEPGPRSGKGSWE